MVTHCRNVDYKYLIVIVAYVSFFYLFILALYVFIDFLPLGNTVFECMYCLYIFCTVILFIFICVTDIRNKYSTNLKKSKLCKLSIVSAKLKPRPSANLKGRRCGIRKGSVNVIKLEEKLLKQIDFP